VLCSVGDHPVSSQQRLGDRRTGSSAGHCHRACARGRDRIVVPTASGPLYHIVFSLSSSKSGSDVTESTWPKEQQKKNDEWEDEVEERRKTTTMMMTGTTTTMNTTTAKPRGRCTSDAEMSKQFVMLGRLPY